MYYLKSQPAVNPLVFGLDHNTILRIEKNRNYNKSKLTEADDQTVLKHVIGNDSEDALNNNPRANLESCESCC